MATTMTTKKADWSLVRITSGYQILNNDKDGPPVIAYLADTVRGPRGTAECRANAEFLMVALARAMQDKSSQYCSHVAADVAAACFARAAAERTELEARAERAEAYVADLGRRLAESEAREAATEGRRQELAQDYERLLDERAEERMAHISTEAALEARAEQAEAAERDLQVAADMAAAYIDSIAAERDALQARVVELEAALRDATGYSADPDSVDWPPAEAAP